MPRKVTASLERKVSPDRKYQSVLVQRLINKSMLDGKKHVAERAVYSAIEGAAKKLKSENPVEVLEQAIKNVSPDFEVKSRRVGGANYQIPFPIAGHRQLHFAMSWMVQAARARSGMPYAKRLEAVQEERRLPSYGRSKPCIRTLCTRLIAIIDYIKPVTSVAGFYMLENRRNCCFLFKKCLYF